MREALRILVRTGSEADAFNALARCAPGPQRQPPPELAGLSARERELVTLVAQGRTDAQIAAEPFISVRTVGSHLDRIRTRPAPAAAPT